MHSPLARSSIQFKLDPLHSPVQLLVGVIELIHGLFALMASTAFQAFLSAQGVGGLNSEGIFFVGLFFAAIGAHNVHDAFAATNHTGLICQLGTFIGLGISITILETHSIPMFFLLPTILLVLVKFEQMKLKSPAVQPRRSTRSTSTRKRKEEKEEEKVEEEEKEEEEEEEDDVTEEEEPPQVERQSPQRRSSRKHKD